MPKMVQSVSAFPVYKESVQKLYVPLYWGAERFGWPSSVRVPAGDDISLEFAGSMREYQESIAGKAWPTSARTRWRAATTAAACST